jgi:hypothetical protein
MEARGRHLSQAVGGHTVEELIDRITERRRRSVGPHSFSPPHLPWRDQPIFGSNLTKAAV